MSVRSWTWHRTYSFSAILFIRSHKDWHCCLFDFGNSCYGYGVGKEAGLDSLGVLSIPSCFIEGWYCSWEDAREHLSWDFRFYHLCWHQKVRSYCQKYSLEAFGLFSFSYCRHRRGWASRRWHQIHPKPSSNRLDLHQCPLIGSTFY